jgi:integrase
MNAQTSTAGLLRKKKAAIANLPSGIGVNKVSNGKTEFWRVRLGKRFTGGAVQTKHFADLADARNWIFGGAQKEKAEPGSVVALEQRYGAAAFVLTPAQINEAAWAVQNLPAGTSLTEAVKFFNRHHRQDDQARRISEVAAEIATAKTLSGRQRGYVARLARDWRRFAADLGDPCIHEVTIRVVHDWLDEHKQFSILTRRNWRRDLGILFAYAAKQGYAASNPIEGIERPEVSDSEIKVLSVPETSKLLANADEDARPVLAIGLFAGLRMSEILALTWEEVDLCERTITVQGRKAKTRQRRIVTISDNLRDWLALTPAGEQTGPVWKQGFWGWYNRRLALDVPRNALRHSFGSYHYALHKNENRTAAEMGNSPSMVFRHYRAVVTPLAAKAYWQLSPPNRAANLVEFSAA